MAVYFCFCFVCFHASIQSFRYTKLTPEIVYYVHHNKSFGSSCILGGTAVSGWGLDWMDGGVQGAFRGTEVFKIIFSWLLCIFLLTIYIYIYIPAFVQTPKSGWPFLKGRFEWKLKKWDHWLLHNSVTVNINYHCWVILFRPRLWHHLRQEQNAWFHSKIGSLTSHNASQLSYLSKVWRHLAFVFCLIWTNAFWLSNKLMPVKKLWCSCFENPLYVHRNVLSEQQLLHND